MGKMKENHWEFMGKLPLDHSLFITIKRKNRNRTTKWRYMEVLQVSSFTSYKLFKSIISPFMEWLANLFTIEYAYTSIECTNPKMNCGYLPHVYNSLSNDTTLI